MKTTTKFITNIKQKAAILALGALASVSTALGMSNTDVTNITNDVTSLGTILSALVGLLQTVIVANIGIFITIIIVMVLLYIIKRFGWSFADFFEGILGGMFREQDRK